MKKVHNNVFIVEYKDAINVLYKIVVIVVMKMQDFYQILKLIQSFNVYVNKKDLKMVKPVLYVHK
jgi:predicted transcriptional regulator